MDLSALEGVEIGGRFRLIRLLGKGGYGAVFEAEQLSMGRICAVKILAPKVANDVQAAKRFEHEARTTSQLSHPNTIVIFDFGRDEERQILYLAMEYLEGDGLDALIENKGMLTVHESLHIAHQIAESLDDAHNRGVVHRDVKPQNVMVVAKGSHPQFVKVIDFGLVKVIAGDIPTRSTFVELTKTGVVVGTPAYMSPEQIETGKTDGRSDQYSLAVTVYAMLTGRTPFIGLNPIDIATKHLTEKPLPPSTYRKSLKVSDAFESVLMRALSKKPEDRFATCVEFVNELISSSRFEGIEEVSAEVTMNLRPNRDAATTEPAAPSETDTMLLDMDAKFSTDEITGHEDTEAIRAETPGYEGTIAMESPGQNPEPEVTSKTVRASSDELEQVNEEGTLVAPKSWPDFEDRPEQKTSQGINVAIVFLVLVGLSLISIAIFLAVST